MPPRRRRRAPSQPAGERRECARRRRRRRGGGAASRACPHCDPVPRGSAVCRAGAVRVGGPRTRCYSRRRGGNGGAAMVRAYVLITVTAGKALRLVTRLECLECVLHVDSIAGKYYAIAYVEAAYIAAIGRLI